MRSLLFVPADSEKKLAKAIGAGADALVADLEDGVLPERKPVARGLMREFFASAKDRSRIWIRVNDLASGEILKDLAATVPLRPAGIVLPKIRGPEDLETVGHYLEAFEAASATEPGTIAILGVITETPSMVLRMGELLHRKWPRLKALTWGGEDLSAALGSGDPRSQTGAWRSVYEHARNQCLLAGHALGIGVLDTVYVDFRNVEGLRRSCEDARYDGFTGRVAIHPDQVAVINEAFTPSPEEIAHANRVVEVFSAGAGAASLDGKMIDIPHLKAAQRVLERSKAFK